MKNVWISKAFNNEGNDTKNKRKTSRKKQTKPKPKNPANITIF